jgi:hypothetical protein
MSTSVSAKRVINSCSVTDRVYDGKPIRQDRDQDGHQQGVTQSAAIRKEMISAAIGESRDRDNLRIDDHNNRSQCGVERISFREAEVATSDCGGQVSVQFPLIIEFL